VISTSCSIELAVLPAMAFMADGAQITRRIEGAPNWIFIGLGLKMVHFSSWVAALLTLAPGSAECHCAGNAKQRVS
jgi:hypothetical protein